MLIGWGAVIALCMLVEAGFRLFAAEPEDAPLWIPFMDNKTAVWRRSPIHMQDRTNSFGMRSREIAREKPSGVYRVLCLGESSTFGAKVEQDELYASVIERCLPGRIGGAVEVLNAGAPGYSLVQSYAYLESRALAFEPDVVVLYHGCNDFLSRSFVGQRVDDADGGDEGLTDLQLLEHRTRWPRRVASWFVEHSRALRVLLSRAVEPPAATPVVETLPRGDEPFTRVPEPDRRAMLTEILSLLEPRAIELVIVVPSYKSFDAHRSLLLEFAAQEGIPVVDVERLIARNGRGRKHYFLDVVHPSPLLHGLIGEALCEALAALPR